MVQRSIENKYCGLIIDNTASAINWPEISNNYLFKHVRHLNNSTPRNSERLSKAFDDLDNIKRDGECLIKGCLPKNYIIFEEGK